MTEIQVNIELLKNVQSVLENYDKNNDDLNVVLHYLSAIIAHHLSVLPGTLEDKQKYLHQLFQFSNQVLTDHNLPDEKQPEA